eukprot:3667715-Rhodomonas_salina.2
MAGTDLVYGAVGLRECYAVSGTDLAYAATRFLAIRSLLSQYSSLPTGTALLFAYARARRCP